MDSTVTIPTREYDRLIKLVEKQEELITLLNIRHHKMKSHYEEMIKLYEYKCNIYKDHLEFNEKSRFLGIF